MATEDDGYRFLILMGCLEWRFIDVGHGDEVKDTPSEELGMDFKNRFAYYI